MRSALALALALGGCGYRFTLRGVGEPVYVPVFENNTTEAGAGALVAEALRRELAVRGIEGGEAAPRRIEGEVVQVEFRPGALTAAARPATYIVSLTLRARGSGKSFSLDRTISGTEEYLTDQDNPDPLAWEAARRAALARLAARLMQAFAAELAAGFMKSGDSP
jgi:hypothetical protein